MEEVATGNEGGMTMTKGPEVIAVVKDRDGWWCEVRPRNSDVHLAFRLDGRGRPYVVRRHTPDAQVYDRAAMYVPRTAYTEALRLAVAVIRGRQQRESE